MNIEDIELIKTCNWAPEQYEAFINGTHQQIGYLRLRHGLFTVSYPNHFGEIIYEVEPKGDGEFNDDEREYYLSKAKKAILNKIEQLKTEVK